MPALNPTSELVTLAWIVATTGIACDINLPEDNTTWATDGFVTVRVIGGSPLVHLPQRQPVMSIDAWAVQSGSARPPWLKASSLAERIYAATIPASAKRQVDLSTVVSAPATYLHAHVQSVVALGEPRPIPSDQAGYAHTQFDLQLRWVAAAT